MKGRLRLAIGLAVSGVCLYLVLRGIDFGELWRVYRYVDYIYLLPALIVLVLISLARAHRWRALMYPERSLSVARLFAIVNIGYLFNNIFPAKAGEVVRGYLAGRSISGGMARALSTLVVERLLDVLSVAVMLVVLIPFVALPSQVMRAGLLFGAGALGGMAVLLVLAKTGERGLEWAWRILERLPLVGHPRVRALLHSVQEGLTVLTVAQSLPGIVGWSASIWLGYALFNYILLFAFGLGHLPFSAAVLVLVATGLGMVVPSSPGAVGVFEGAAMLALSVFGVEQSQAFGYAFGLHMLTNLALIVIGLLGLRSESLTFSSVRETVMERPAVATSASGGQDV